MFLRDLGPWPRGVGELRDVLAGLAEGWSMSRRRDESGKNAGCRRRGG
jgi:hypothetical protein